MEPPAAEPPAPGHLTRGRIVRAAIALVDRDGLTALSMRRLGSDLGVEAMALYRHVDGREDLLEAMVEELTATLESAVPREDGTGWQAYLQHLAHAVRDLAAAHPRLFPLIATRHPAAPWLRPPLRSLAMVEAFLTTLTRHGFGEDAAVAAYRSFTSFLVGILLLEVAQRDASVVPEGEEVERESRRRPDDETLAGFPTVRRLRERLSEDRADEEFEAALEDLLDRLAVELAP